MAQPAQDGIKEKVKIYCDNCLLCDFFSYFVTCTYMPDWQGLQSYHLTCHKNKVGGEDLDA